MMLIDANILIYAYDGSSPLHHAAKPWLEKTLSGAEPIRMAWMTILAFLRITTHRKIFANPYSVSEAAAIVNDWLAQPCMGILQPTARHWPILTVLLRDGQATGPLVMDAYLAALAIEHGATLCSTDQDFTRFNRLKLVNPLAATG
ncbi:MAG TPA: type II toxin-antitoxin system VapC family toxin [Xanthomonadaceae bacterium]|nr:type II toxin-antitoxin system VapC family toxin [Xanthomonadaceae bacterium]